MQCAAQQTGLWLCMPHIHTHLEVPIWLDPSQHCLHQDSKTDSEFAESRDGVKMSTLKRNICPEITSYFKAHNLSGDTIWTEQKLECGWVSSGMMIQINRFNCVTKDPNHLIAPLRKSKAGLKEMLEDQNSNNFKPVCLTTGPTGPPFGVEHP